MQIGRDEIGRLEVSVRVSVRSMGDDDISALPIDQALERPTIEAECSPDANNLVYPGFECRRNAEIISAQRPMLTDTQSQGTRVAYTVARGGKMQDKQRRFC